MNLWIRSQDKETIVKIVDGLYYYYNEETKEHTIHNGYNDLGIYKSKERALEVLDEIYKELCKSSSTITPYDILYEMPKE